MHSSRYSYKATLSFILCTALLLLTTMAFAQSPPSKVDDQIAIVNGVSISKKYFEKAFERAKAQEMAKTGQELDAEAVKKLKNKLLEDLIAGELLFQEGSGVIKVTDDDVNKQFSKFKDNFPNDEAFKSWLSQNGITELEILTELKRSLTVEGLIKTKYMSQIDVPDAEIQAFYDNNPQAFIKPESVKASHILITVAPTASEDEKKEAHNKIKAIQKKINAGGDFATLAKENSQCPSSANGGDLNYFTRGRMVKPFEDAAFALKVGEVSDIVETQFGYHLIKVTDKQETTTVKLAEVKDKLKQFLKDRKMQQFLIRHVEEIKNEASIERFLN